MFVLLLGLILVGSAGAAYWQWQSWRETSRRVEFVVPLGTTDRIAAGKPVNVLPAKITLRIGHQDILVIRNEDNKTVQIGPYKIEPGQQFRQQYVNVGIFDVMCSLHSEQRLRVVVTR